MSAGDCAPPPCWTACKSYRELGVCSFYESSLIREVPGNHFRLCKLTLTYTPKETSNRLAPNLDLCSIIILVCYQFPIWGVDVHFHFSPQSLTYRMIQNVFVCQHYILFRISTDYHARQRIITATIAFLTASLSAITEEHIWSTQSALLVQKVVCVRTRGDSTTSDD